MSGKHFTGLFKKQQDQLIYSSPKDKQKYELFLQRLGDDHLVEVYMEEQRDDGTLAQLAKVHAMVRELALHIGETFEDMKLLVKRKAGLCIEKEVGGEKYLYCKSLGKCSKEELALCIEAMKQIGYDLDYPIE